MGEGADRGADGGETMAARGGEGAGEAEGFERIGGVGEKLRGGEVGVKIGEQRDEAKDDRGIGVDAEMTAVVAQLGDEPDRGDATRHAVGGGALGGRELGPAARAVDDGGEAFVRIVEGEQVVQERLLAGRKAHEAQTVELVAKIQGKLAVNSWNAPCHDRQRSHSAARFHAADGFSMARALHRGG